MVPLSGLEHLFVFGRDVVEGVGNADLHRRETHGPAPRERVGEMPVDQLGHADGKFQREGGGMGVPRFEHDPPHIAPFAEFGQVSLRKPPVPACDDVDQFVDGWQDARASAALIVAAAPVPDDRLPDRKLVHDPLAPVLAEVPYGPPDVVQDYPPPRRDCQGRLR